MKSEILTILGILALGLNLGGIQAYLDTPGTANSFGEMSRYIGVTTVISLSFLVIMFFALMESSKPSGSIVMLTILLSLTTALELYIVYSKDESWIDAAKVTIYLISFFKLYLLVTLHTDVSSKKSKAYFDKLANDILNPSKPKPEPKPEPKSEPEAKVEPKLVNDREAKKILNDALALTELTDEEKLEISDRFEDELEKPNPWQGSVNIFSNNVMNKIRRGTVSDEEKAELRSKFRIAMGR